MMPPEPTADATLASFSPVASMVKAPEMWIDAVAPTAASTLAWSETVAWAPLNAMPSKTEAPTDVADAWAVLSPEASTLTVDAARTLPSSSVCTPPATNAVGNAPDTATAPPTVATTADAKAELIPSARTSIEAPGAVSSAADPT